MSHAFVLQDDKKTYRKVVLSGGQSLPGAFAANTDEALQRAWDLTSLAYLDEPNLLAALDYRYQRNMIYTNMSGILIAVNPYRDLNLYDLQTYTYDKKHPHIFNVAHQARQALSHLNARTLDHHSQTIIRKLSKTKKNLVFMLWGKHAIEANKYIEQPKNHLILTASHPSPLSYTTATSQTPAYKGCRHFSKCNEYLEKSGQAPIQW